MRRPIKHYVEDGDTDLAGALKVVKDILIGTTAADPYSAAGKNVNGGSAIIRYIEIDFDFWVNNKVNTSTLLSDQLDYFVWFNIAGNQTVPTPNSCNISDLKNQIFAKRGAVLGCASVVQSILNINSRHSGTIRLKVPPQWQSINKDDKIQFVYQFSDAASTHNLKLSSRFVEYEQA